MTEIKEHEKKNVNMSHYERKRKNCNKLTQQNETFKYEWVTKNN